MPRPSKPVLPLSSLNHISIVVSDVSKSKEFYINVIGFVEVVRPSSFDFQGSWLWRQGMAIHLIKGKPLDRPHTICPLADHISFQVHGSLDDVERQLSDLGIQTVRQQVIEDGIVVDQIFFHDPDNVMIEVCNCDSLPVCPLIAMPVMKNMRGSESSAASECAEECHNNILSDAADASDLF